MKHIKMGNMQSIYDPYAENMEKQIRIDERLDTIAEIIFLIFWMPLCIIFSPVFLLVWALDRVKMRGF